MIARSHDPDLLARRLGELAAMARAMPPAFDGAEVSEPVFGPGGEVVGQLLDGRGLYVNHDLRSFGITRAIPHVYERSRTQRLLDVIGDARGTITTYDGLVAARSDSTGKYDDVQFNKSTAITTVAGEWFSTFTMAGSPGAGSYTAIPTGAVMNRASAGALSLGMMNPAGADNKYLVGLGLNATVQLTPVIVADLLVAAGGVSANSTSAQTVSTAALTRYTGGAGVLVTCEVTTQLGGTASNLTLSYTNQAGTASRSTGAIAMTTNCIVHRLQPRALGPFMQLQSTDFGVRAVATATMSAKMLAGVFAILLYKPLVLFVGTFPSMDVYYPIIDRPSALAQLVVGSSSIGCLTLFTTSPSGTSSGTFGGRFRTCSG